MRSCSASTPACGCGLPDGLGFRSSCLPLPCRTVWYQYTRGVSQSSGHGALHAFTNRYDRIGWTTMNRLRFMSLSSSCSDPESTQDFVKVGSYSLTVGHKSLLACRAMYSSGVWKLAGHSYPLPWWYQKCSDGLGHRWPVGLFRGQPAYDHSIRPSGSVRW